jgi:hypothetical protein
VQLFLAAATRQATPLNDILQLWKTYLVFLKQHQQQITSSGAESLVASLGACVSEGLDSSFLEELHGAEDSSSAALSRKLQLLLFFCQRLITTIVYLSERLCDETILQSYEQLLLCRGVCFSLGNKFPDQESITTKLSKFDGLFVNSLELQPSQLHRSDELQRRVELYHATVSRTCSSTFASATVYHKYTAVGILSYTSNTLHKSVLGSHKLPVEGDPVATTREPVEANNALRLSLLEVVLSVEFLTVSYCGQIADEVRKERILYFRFFIDLCAPRIFKLLSPCNEGCVLCRCCGHLLLKRGNSYSTSFQTHWT